MTDMTYALWGRGDLAPENAKALLEEYIPDNVGAVYWPGVHDRDHQGLRNALDWFESDDFLGEGGAIPTTDIVQSLIDSRESEFKDEVYLLALWPENPTHEEFDFIESVQAAGITVFDLSRALDELDLSLYSRPDPTKEEKAEARAAATAEKRGRGRPKKLSDDVPKEDVQHPATEEEVPVYGVTKPSVPAPRAEISHEDLKVAVLNEMFSGSTAEALIAALDAYIDSKIVEVLAQRSLAGNEKEQDTARPPFEGPYVDPNSKQYYKNLTTGKLRPAAGAKPRKGEVVVNLTDEELIAEEEPPF